MKKFIGLLAVAVLMSVSAFSQKPTYYAKVNKVEGLYIYVNCEPIDQYEELGYLKKKGLWWQCQYTEIFNYFFKRCKKNTPKRTLSFYICLPKEVKQQRYIFLM